MKKKTILLLATGGTIDSAEQNGIISLAKDDRPAILKRYEAQFGTDGLTFQTKSPYRILSENLDGAHLNLLLSHVEKTLAAQKNAGAALLPDGILVLHGTDTLQYTAAALGLCFSDTPVPILLVSANYVPGHPLSNGLENFRRAVEAVMEEASPGVYVSWQNSGDREARLYPAASLLPHLPYEDILFSLPDAELPGAYETASGNPSCTDMLIKSLHRCCPGLSLPGPGSRLSDPSPVLLVTPAPGQPLPQTEKSTKAVLFSTYHSGTLKTAGAEFGNFVTRAGQAGISCYVLSGERTSAYESTKAFSSLGLIPLPRLSPVTAYLLLWFYYSKP